MKKIAIAGLVVVLIVFVVWFFRPVGLDLSEQKARAWIETNATTYLLDGSGLALRNSIDESANGCAQCYVFVYEFVSEKSGYGSRREDMDQNIPTPHLIVVHTERGKVVEAVTDGYFDELNRKYLGL